jgi:hypothetical protein
MLNLRAKKQMEKDSSGAPPPQLAIPLRDSLENTRREVFIGYKTHVCLLQQLLELTCNCAVNKV